MTLSSQSPDQQLRTERQRHPLETLKAGTIKVAAFEGFAPFAWREGNKACGRDIAFLQRFATARQMDLSVEFFGFDQLWELPARGKADIAASGISLSPHSRTGGTRWSAPYSRVRRTLLLRREDSPHFRRMADFTQNRIAVVARSVAHEHFLEAAPSGARLSFCETLDHGIRDLLAGRVDAVGTGDVSARHHLSLHAGLTLLDVHDARNPEYLSFAVRPSGRLRETLDAFIATHASLY